MWVGLVDKENAPLASVRPHSYLLLTCSARPLKEVSPFAGWRLVDGWMARCRPNMYNTWRRRRTRRPPESCPRRCSLFWTITFSMNPYGLSRRPETNVQGTDQQCQQGNLTGNNTVRPPPSHMRNLLLEPFCYCWLAGELIIWDGTNGMGCFK